MVTKAILNEYLIVAVGVVGIGVLILGGLALLDHTTRATGIRPTGQRAQPATPTLYALVVHPPVGEPVEIARALEQSRCAAQRDATIRLAVLQGHAVPSLTCVSMTPSWWTRLSRWL